MSTSRRQERRQIIANFQNKGASIWFKERRAAADKVYLLIDTTKKCTFAQPNDWRCVVLVKLTNSILTSFTEVFNKVVVRLDPD